MLTENLPPSGGIKPSEKSEEMEKFIKNISGKDRRETITNRECMVCGGPAWHFRDNLSRKEYSISGMCQKCQDKTFGK